MTDLLKKTNLDLKHTWMIRYSLSDKECKECYDQNEIKEYTQIQNSIIFNHPEKYRYFLVFLSDQGTSAVFYKCYKVKNYCTDIEDPWPKTESLQDKKLIYFELEETEILSGYENKLVIEWGKAAIAWKQNAWNQAETKKILSIYPSRKIPFPGYENVVLTFNQLCEIMHDVHTYAEWHTALSTVYGIYLIVDQESGRQYVGSAYGEGGLLQRWSVYVNTKHGNNKKMQQLISEEPDIYHNFQFSILQICPMSMTEEQVLHLENLYKIKLMTKQFGLNDN